MSDLTSDALVAGLLVAIMAGMAALLNGQFHFRARLEHFLRDREARVRLLTDNIADIVIVIDRKGCLQYVSPSVAAVLGMEENAFLGRACLEMVHEDDREKIAGASRRLKEAGACPSVRFRMQRSGGETIWLECRFKMAGYSSGRKPEIVGVLRDVTRQQRLEQELSSANLRLAQLATTDGLTRLANRRSFDAFLREAYARYPVLSVLLIDIDHFKGFNDALGHQAGDRCLQQIAQTIGSATAETGGFSARYGGEEFAVVLPGVAEAKAVKVADAIRLLVSRLSIDHPRSPRKRVTISVGVAEKSATTESELALTREADIALYQAKEHGRDCTVASSTLVPGSLELASLVPAISDVG
ncbi:GGDEF domain-containing protein [Bradyrhizobium japonicum]|uniref:GGDEF domain-containing protein n=1 Tax=Bradyrhizobium japonicum TaxID=375 RepID=UPI001AEBAAA4|nr:sensor domain-containing diguanylate cyclase [Bradyrhizobium japonicum]